MITAAKVEKLIKTFERVLPHARETDSFSMSESYVSVNLEEIDEYDIEAYDLQEHRCGTTHCHAGWYLLGKVWDLKSKFLPEYKFSDALSFEDGVEEMEDDLGCDVALWAGDNPELWGNSHGEKMFYSERAFGDDCTTLDEVVNHWKGVHKRLLQKEKGITDNE